MAGWNVIAYLSSVTKAGQAVSADSPLPVAQYTGAALVSATNPMPVLSGGSSYETVATGQTDQVMGATGAVGDYLAGVLIVPSSASPGAVTIKDGNGPAITIFAGGPSSVVQLTPFYVQIGAKAVNATTPGWKITTGVTETAIGFGIFT